jgi:uncharacterized protein
VDAAAGRITARGGKILSGPMEVSGADRVVTAMDPQGAAFGLHAKRPHPRRPMNGIALNTVL